jgi:predicted dehydrogenase/threonine dehydrogenase-like Zn-dependent dehydrogenase
VREILQSLRESRTGVVEAAAPRPRQGHVIVRTHTSVLSAGTERMLVDFAKAGLIGKARQQPERVRQVIDKVQTDGLASAVEGVRARLDEPISMGYASSGTVISVGPGVVGFAPGDFVACSGHHAEIVSIPATLCVLVPAEADPTHAAFATLGAVALEGMRLASPALGETFVVTGLGLIGLLAVQLLRAHGCDVVGIDFDESRLKLAESFGAHVVRADGDPVALVNEFTKGRGADGVLVTASTKSSDPIHQAAQMSRQRGRIVLVGVTGLALDRSDFYEKELSFQVSCSYGPGRYDPTYDEHGQDYPLGFVRWTAGRNMEAMVAMVASQRLAVEPLITHRFPLDRAQDAYDALTSDPTALAVVLTYPQDEIPVATLLRSTITTGAPVNTGTLGRGVGVIGAGSFASQVLLPALRSNGVQLRAIASNGGSAAASAARRFGVERATNDSGAVIDALDVDVVFVVTRHNSHAALVERALDAGKPVFVEKPLSIDSEGLERVLAAWERRVAAGTSPLVGIGFNRRFSAITRRMVETLGAMPVPRAITITVNAGAVPPAHWVHDPLVGGGRIVGEACHFLDLARHLAGSPITEVSASYLEQAGPADSASITLAHADGSVSNVNYFANGSKRLPKERVTVFAGGRVLVNDNFRKLTGFGWPGFRTMRLRKQDKGHAAGIAAFLAAVRGEGPPPIAFEEIVEVTAASLIAAGRG